MMLVSAHDLAPLMRSISSRLHEIERRLAGVEWRGKAYEIDPKEGTVRLEIGKDKNGTPVLSPKVPYKAVAGALKLHSPPSKGQPMVIRSETGDIEQGTAEALHWSDENPANSDKGDEHKLTFGSTTISISDGGSKTHIECGGASITFEGGEVRING